MYATWTPDWSALTDADARCGKQAAREHAACRGIRETGLLHAGLVPGQRRSG
jgi:hypothetical protein